MNKSKVRAQLKRAARIATTAARAERLEARYTSCSGPHFMKNKLAHERTVMLAVSEHSRVQVTVEDVSQRVQFNPQRGLAT